MVFFFIKNLLSKRSANPMENVDSFYEFPTGVNANVNKTIAPGSGVTKKVTCLGNTKKPPGWKEVFDSCLDHDIFEQRTLDVKAYGVAFGEKTDADASSGMLISYLGCIKLTY